MNAAPRPRPRAISLGTATGIVVANMIGTGVFTSLGFQVSDLPTGFSIVALWLLGGFCAWCGALAYGELAAALPRSGGEYHLLSEVYHPALGFMAGWLSITVGFAAPVALVAGAFGAYFAQALPGVPPLYVSMGLILSVTAVQLIGGKLGSQFQNAATLLKVTLILVLIGAGLLMPNPQPVSFLPAPGDAARLTSAAFAHSLIFVMYAYTGWNAAAYIVGEIRNPSRNVPLAVSFGTAFVAVLYVVLNAVFLRAAPAGELAAGKLEVAQVAAQHIFGGVGGRVVSGFICAGLVASTSAMVWIGPRVASTMGEDWRILRSLAWRSSRGIPVWAMLFQSAVACTLLLTVTFEKVLKFIQFGLSVCSFCTVLGVYVLRVRRPNLPRPCRAWGYPFTPAVYLVVSAWMLFYIVKDSPVESLYGVGIMVLGLLLFALSPRNLPAPRDSTVNGT